MTETEKIRAARAAYMRDYARKRRRSSQEMREREKESRDRPKLAYLIDATAAPVCMTLE